MSIKCSCILSFFFFFFVVAEYNCNSFLRIALCFYTALYFFSVLYCNHVFFNGKQQKKTKNKGISDAHSKAFE